MTASQVATSSSLGRGAPYPAVPRQSSRCCASCAARPGLPPCFLRARFKRHPAHGPGRAAAAGAAAPRDSSGKITIGLCETVSQLRRTVLASFTVLGLPRGARGSCEGLDDGRARRRCKARATSRWRPRLWCESPQHGLSSKKMALVTLDYGAMRYLGSKWP